MKLKGQSSSGLRIIIVGAGKVGRTLVEQLSNEGHDITIVDQDAYKVREISSNYDIMGCVGNGASYTTQAEAGINDADLIIAVTESDELNLLCCTIASQFSNCASIARVRTPDYSKEVNYLREKLGLAMIINPELESAKEMARLLYLPTALEINSFAHGQAEIVKLKIPEGNKIDGMAIYDLGKNLTNDILICAVERDNDVTIPRGDFVLKAGDNISFVATHKAATYFLNLIGFDTKQVKNTMIIGGGRAAYYLADQLIRNGIDVKIIERSRTRCEELVELLPKALIINGDGTDPALLKEEGILGCESFVPLTGIDEENVMLSLHVKSISDAKLITKINRSGFSEVISKLDLGSVVYPRYVTSEAIIAYVRARSAAKDSNIETMYHMFGSRAEAIEFKVTNESELTGKELRDLKLKDNLLISFIIHDGKTIIPAGNDKISVGDSVMVVTTHLGFTDITNILK